MDESDFESLAVLPEEVPVVMPELPHTRVLSTVQQLKALGDPLRARILGIIQYQPATAKQIADRLEVTPSSIGHHLHVLEAAGLVQLVARRSVRGTLANYYTRTAFFFRVDLPPDIAGKVSGGLDRITQASDELAKAIEATPDASVQHESFLHLKLSPSRAQEYERHMQALTDTFLQEEPDINGQVYAFYTALFLAPPTLQVEQQAQEPEPHITRTEDQS